MSQGSSRTIIIDASIARSSGGEDATYPLSRDCRDFLKAILTICHHAAMSPDLTEEWKNHESNWARRWRTAMVARKKLLRIQPALDTTLRSKLVALAATDREAEAMLKDCHLLEAALATDQCVASLDEKARGLFADAAQTVKLLGRINWVNPGHAHERAIAWLENGAPPDKARQLGGYASM